MPSSLILNYDYIEFGERYGDNNRKQRVTSNDK